MLMLPTESMLKQAQEAREGLNKHFNSEMEKILNQQSFKDKYWILGKVKFPEEFGGQVARAFLQACDEKPGLVTSSFVYEVDNRRGTKEILWIMNPDGSLRIPSLNKTIQATPANGRKMA